MSEEETSGTPLEPLLTKYSSSAPSNANVAANIDNTAPTMSNSDQQNDPATPSAALLGCCTLALVLVGLGLVLFISFLPLWITLSLSHYLPISYWKGILLALLLNIFHLRALWVSARYLRVMRALVLPIRRLLLPLVIAVAHIESIREEETTQYYNSATTTTTSINAPEFRKSVRRHYRRMEKIYQRAGIRHHCVRGETSLVLRDVIPIVWQHQKRSTDNASPIDDFIKRALVLTVVPDGVLDLYNNPQGELVSVQFSILTGNVWHWFMFFSLDKVSRAGIWWHGALLAIQRGNATEGVDWVNAQVHQRESKLHAGYTAASHTERDTLSQVYPLTWTRRIPNDITSLRLWDSASQDAS